MSSNSAFSDTFESNDSLWTPTIQAEKYAHSWMRDIHTTYQIFQFLALTQLKDIGYSALEKRLRENHSN